MIHSMTAYARHEIRASWGNAVWEIRSVNQRYLESYFRLPEQFRCLEGLLRDKLRQKLHRGKLEINLKYSASNTAGELKINEALAKQLMQSASSLAEQSGKAQLNVVDILRWPGVMETQEEDIDSLQAELMAAFDAALVDFVAGRGREGVDAGKARAARGRLGRHPEPLAVEIGGHREAEYRVVQRQTHVGDAEE